MLDAITSFPGVMLVIFGAVAVAVFVYEILPTLGRCPRRPVRRSGDG